MALFSSSVAAVSFATVMTLLFTMRNNSDLLNLHAHQQHPRCQGETRQLNTGWIKALAKALQTRLGEATDSLLCNFEQKLTDDEVTNSNGIKLDSLSKVLKLHPYNQRGVFLGKLNPISEQSIEPVHVICPAAMECETRTCNSCAILKKTSIRDTPTVTLIKGTRLYNDVSALSGHCPQCKTGYYADHEHVQKDGGQWMKLYLNSAKYLKVGQSLWVDRSFSKAVLNGVYHFHASTSAFAEFWNCSFWETQETLVKKD